MNLLQDIQKLALKKVPKLKIGQTVRVHQRIKEGEKERVQLFEGLIIKINSGYGADKTITVRKVVDGIGVEKIFPIYSTNIVKLEVIKEAKVRRAKLYYMRDRSGKSARLKETFVSRSADEANQEEVEEAPAAEVAVEESQVEESPVEEAAVEAETSETAETPAEEVATETEEAPAEETPAEESAEEEEKNA